MHIKITTRKTSSTGSHIWKVIILTAAFSLLLTPITGARAQQSALYEGVDLSEKVQAQVNQYRKTYTQAIEDEQYDEAEKASKQALALVQEFQDSTLYLALLSEHIVSLQKTGKLRQAEPLAREEIALRRKYQGNSHPTTVDRISAYADLLRKLGLLSEAEPLFVEAHAARQKTLGDGHPKTKVSLERYKALQHIQKRNISEIVADFETTIKSIRSEYLKADQEGNVKDAQSTAVVLLNIMQKSGDVYSDLYRQILHENESLMRRTGQEKYADRYLKEIRCLEENEGLECFFRLQNNYNEELGFSDSVRAQLEQLEKQAHRATKEKRFADAIEFLTSSMKIIAQAAGRDSVSFDNERQNMVLTFIRNDQPRKAVRLSEEALTFQRKTYTTSYFGEPDYPALLRATNRHAKTLSDVGRPREAEPLYAENLRISRKYYGSLSVYGQVSTETLTALNDYANSLLALDRLSDAEPLAAEVLQLGRVKYGPRSPKTSTFMGNYAAILSALARADEALPLYATALDIMRDAQGENHPATLISQSNYAAGLTALNRYSEAESISAEVLHQRRKQLGNNHSATIISLGNHASILTNLNRWTEAEPLQVEFLKLAREKFGFDHPRTLNGERNLATLLSRLGRYSEAEPLLVKGLKLSRETLGNRHANTRLTERLLTNTRLNLPALSHLAILPAQSAMEAIKDEIGSVELNARNEAQISRFEEDRHIDFRLFADAAWVAGVGLPQAAKNAGAKIPQPSRLKKLREESFTALQNAMSGTASKAVAETAARRAAEAQSPALGTMARQRQLWSRKWVAIDTLLTQALADNEPGSKGKRRNLRESRTDLENEMEEIDKRLRSEAPDYFAFVRPTALNLKQTKAMLAKDEAVLMVVPTAFGTHVMAVSDDGIQWARSDWKRSQINASVKRLLWDVGASVDVSNIQNAEWLEEGEGAYPFDRGTAFALYNQIVAPVAGTLKGKKHVYIATTGSLSSLPLGILVTEKPLGEDGNPADLRATKWFADRHALIQIPSLQSLQSLRQAKRAAKKQNGQDSFIGFGDPVLLGNAETRGSGGARTRRGNTSNGNGAVTAAFRGQRTRSGAGIADIKALNQMARLPGTAVELESMRRALKAPKTSLFMAAQASERNFRNADLSGVNILTLATHGLLAGEIRGAAEPGLVFTPPAEASEADDGLLTASEIAGLKLNADWVILSACNTAAGDGSEGAPGLSGLARSFFFAGARNLLASHWPVRDDVAAKITVRTIEIKRDNPKLSRAEAFQQAMREIRNNASVDSEDDTWAHPNAWAPFTLIGDGAN